ncbi:MAG: c-type cytochrome [Pseudomonadota bacterium]
MRLPIMPLLIAGAILSPQISAAAEINAMARKGAWEYRNACAVCHGPHGRGDGGMAPLLSVPPTDLTTLSARNAGSFPFDRVFRIIDGRMPVEGHGSSEMPVWGRAFRLEAERGLGPIPFGNTPDLIVAGRIHALAVYLRAIQGGAEIEPEEPTRRRRSMPDDLRMPPIRR